MDLAMNFINTNWLVVMAAATFAFLLGGFWYSPVGFGRFLPKIRTEAESPAEATRHIAVIFTASFLLLWLAAAFLAGLLDPGATMREAIYIGLAIGLFFVFPAHSIAAMFGARPIQIVFINGGFFSVCFAAMGAILVTWG